MVPEMAKPSIGMLAVVAKIANWFKSRRMADVANLQELADRKFSELQVMHTQFVDRVNSLHQYAVQALDRLDKTDDLSAVLSEFRDGLLKVSELRKVEHDLRRERYEEAKAFDEIRLEQVGVVKTIPDEVVESIHAFLKTYASYFENSRTYKHDLARVHDYMHERLMLLLLKSVRRRKIEKQDLVDTLNLGVEETATAEQILRQRWQEVARSYHRLNAVLLKYGFKRALRKVKTTGSEASAKETPKGPTAKRRTPKGRSP